MFVFVIKCVNYGTYIMCDMKEIEGN